jgi:uncharacterized membrane protein YuzA (DUF378 family)
MRNPYDAIGRIGLLLAIIGAVNWLLVGLFEWNLVQWIFTQSGTQTVDNLGERVVYIVVGVGAVLAIPMLAATLSRARRGDVSERSERGYASDSDASDTAFYYGAPKEGRLEERSDVAAASTEGSAEQSVPVRKTERVIIRTEEPLTGSRETSTYAESASADPGMGTDQRLRTGPVEEADDELGEERRAA